MRSWLTHKTNNVLVYVRRSDRERSRSRPRAFQQAIDEMRTLPLTPLKGSSESEFVVL